MSEQERDEKEDIMKYVISDIHGMWDKYQNMLKLINFSAEDELYILGDVIDRGEDGIKILQDIRKHTNMHLLMGNHELMAVQTLFAQDENEWNEKMIVWAVNGGEETYYSFLELSEEEQKEITELMANLPDYIEVEVNGRIFYLVHGFPADTLEKQVWTRPKLNTKNPFKDKTLIVGHTPVMLLHDNPDRYIRMLQEKEKHVEIEHAEGFIDIDCGCGSGIPEERLACLRLDDMEEFYV